MIDFPLHQLFIPHTNKHKQDQYIELYIHLLHKTRFVIFVLSLMHMTDSGLRRALATYRIDSKLIMVHKKDQMLCIHCKVLLNPSHVYDVPV